MKKFTSSLLLLICISNIGGFTSCSKQELTPELTNYEKIVNYVQTNGADNIILIEGTNPKPLDDVKIELVGDFIRLHLGDGNYSPNNEISVMIELDLKKDKSVYNYEADYWYKSNYGNTMIGVEGTVNPKTFDGSTLTYNTYSQYLDRPTSTTMGVFASQMHYMIRTAREHLSTAINVDIAIEFGFDEFL